MEFHSAKKKMTSKRQIVWKVPYEKGTLKVVGKNKGNTVTEKLFVTAGSESSIKLNLDKKEIKPNKTDVVHLEISVVDEYGTMLPDADNLINFEVTGPGKIIGVENGDILDLSPHKVNYRKVFKGKCLLLIQATGKSGEIKIKATSKNLKEATINIISK